MARTAPARYVYLGPEGTFTEAALRNFVGDEEVIAQPTPDVVTALDAVRAGEADFAVVPIENSVEGGVNATLDTLSNGGGLMIVGEVVIPVEFVLAVLPGTTAADIREIATHPHAWAQCRGWVARELGEVAHRPATSTAAAAAELAEAGSREAAGYDAVLCSELSARRYGLATFAHGVADNRGAVTRFIVVTRSGDIHPPTGTDKTTLMVHLPHNEAGALMAMLDQFAVRGVNLSRIESRPIGDSLGRYSFSLDLEGHVAEERVAETLVGLHRVCPVVRFLGSYPRADGGTPRIPRGAAEEDFVKARAWVAELRAAVRPAQD